MPPGRPDAPKAPSPLRDYGYSGKAGRTVRVSTSLGSRSHGSEFLCNINQSVLDGWAVSL